MCLQRFVTSIFIIIIFVPGEENSLLSRFRNPNQFIASEEDTFLPEDLDKNLYSDLVRNIPEVKNYWKALKKHGHENIDEKLMREVPGVKDYWRALKERGLEDHDENIYPDLVRKEPEVKEYFRALKERGLENLDENLYSDLVRKVPEVKQYWRALKERGHEDPIALPYLKKKPTPKEGASDGGEREEVNVTRLALSLLSSLSLDNDSQAASLPRNNSRRSILNWFPYEPSGTYGPPPDAYDLFSLIYKLYYTYIFSGYKVASCYRCGLYVQSQYNKIPISPICHDMFDSDDWRAKTMARYYMADCFKQNEGYWIDRAQPYQTLWGYSRTEDMGLKHEYHGNYVGGCFKRWTDVGKVYTARGCRAYPPLMKSGDTGTWTGHRFRRLEWTLRYEDDACVHSPHASLTPFARGISLFVRYHVCVCKNSLCNRSTTDLDTHSTLLILMLLLNVLYIYTM